MWFFQKRLVSIRWRHLKKNVLKKIYRPIVNYGVIIKSIIKSKFYCMD